MTFGPVIIPMPPQNVKKFYNLTHFIAYLKDILACKFYQLFCNIILQSCIIIGKRCSPLHIPEGDGVHLRLPPTTPLLCLNPIKHLPPSSKIYFTGAHVTIFTWDVSLHVVPGHNITTG